MRIQMAAKAFSRALCVVGTLCLLPLPAHAGVELQRSGALPELEIHFTVMDDIIGIPDGGSRTTAPAAASTFTLVPVGSMDELYWGLSNTGLGTGGWETVDAPTEIPEPAPLAILGIAILALGFYRRHRNS